MELEIALSVFLGVGLAAAAGFRVFVPLLALSIAGYTGVLPLGESFEWLASFPAIISLAIAAIVEILAYYIPWVDNLLDTIAIPLASVAGTAIMAASLTDMSPMITWSLAIIAGGGTAGAIKSLGAGTRVLSSVKTMGIGNPVLSTAETGASVFMIVLSFLAPVVALVCVLLLFYFVFKTWRKLSRS